MPYDPRRRYVCDKPIELGDDVPELRFKSSAPAVVVQCWCGLIERMDRKALDRFTRDIWKRFDERDLEPLKYAIIRRRRVLAMQPWP